ncbi:T9SS type A sorting domain-containing protein [Patescibacteria group bacterium]|nr:T9SS type A sorting domain-containing protein [Patescibacteria group bacterium]
MKTIIIWTIAISLMLATFLFASEANEYPRHPRVLKLAEGEWGDLDIKPPESGQTDNAVGFYFNGSGSFEATSYVIYPADSITVYSDWRRLTHGWDFYVTGSLADHVSAAALCDENYQMLTPYVNFDSLGTELSKVSFFEGHVAYILNRGANLLRLQVLLTSDWNQQPSEGQFYLAHHDINMRPGTPFVWPEDSVLWCSQVYVESEPGELYVTAGVNPQTANVVAGADGVEMEQLRFLAVNENFSVWKLRIKQAELSIYDRSVESVTISYPNEAGQMVEATQTMVSGNADFNITAEPLYAPMGPYVVVDVCFNLAPINQTYGAYTGDLISAGFDCDSNFEAVGSSGTTLTETSNGEDIVGNQMIVHGNFPTIIPDVTTNTILTNGTVELYRWEVPAQEGGTPLTLGQKTFKIHLYDSVPTAGILNLTYLRVLEGSSYETAVELTPGLSGTDAYRVWGENGENLSSPTGHLYADDWTYTVTLTFYDEREIAPGSSKFYILRATASNVNTGACSNDAISTYMYDGDTGYLPPLAADFNPETPNAWGAILDDDPFNLEGEESVASMVWSDATGTYGNYNHAQSSYYGGSSSLDWFNGYKIKTLDVLRVLNGGADKDVQGQIAEVLMEYSIGSYPNPFNPTTTLSFTLPEASHVTLTVCDINGRQVTQLVNGYRESGIHEVTFDGSHLASGIYFYHLASGDFTKVGKMMLVK